MALKWAFGNEEKYQKVGIVLTQVKILIFNPLLCVNVYKCLKCDKCNKCLKFFVMSNDM